MINMITGTIATILFLIFVGEYAVTLHSLPLWVIIVGVASLLIVDYLFSFKAHREMEEAKRANEESED